MSFTNYLIQEAIQYNIENEIPLTKCIYRRESENFYEYFKHLKENKDGYSFEGFDLELVESDIGEFGEFDNEKVPLDLPFVNEEVELNSPKRNQGEGKKYYVYVKNDKGNVIKINFGDKKGGLTAKINDEEARKAFAARHKCGEKKDKTKAGYWSCRLPYYAEELGLSGGGKYWW